MAGNLTAPANSPSSATTAEAIIGNNSLPYGAAILGSGTTTAALSTGDLAAGDAGEMGSVAEFAVEFWFAVEGVLPGVNNTIMAGPLSSSATRQWIITLLAAGNLQLEVVDDGGATRTATAVTALSVSATPTNSGAGTWYHVVCAAQGGNLNIYLNSVVDGTTATWGAHTVRAQGATAGSEDMVVLGSTTSAATNFYFDEIAVYRTGLTQARVTAHYVAGRSRGLYQQLPGLRIGSVLDAANSTAPRSVQAGTRTVLPMYMSGQSPLVEIQHAVEAEDVDAAFFTKADGTMTFLADGHRSSSPYNTSQVTVGDAGGAEIPYESLSVDYSETYLINEWNVTRSASGPDVPITQTVSDASSISKYFKRSQSLSDVPTTTDTNAGNIATALLAKYKDPMLRVTEVTFNLSDPSVAEAVLRRELMDRITVKRTPPGGGSRIDQTLYIQKIELSASNDGQAWKVRWGVSPL